MAYCTPIQTGNYSSASTWGTCTELGTLSNTLTSYLTSSNPGISATFTAPSTSDSAVGFAVICGPWMGSAAVDFTINLQEYNGSSWVTVATHDIDDIGETMYPQYTFRFDLATPYQYTTTTTDYYRWTVYHKSAGNYFKLAQGGGGSYNPYMINIDDRSDIPADGDQLLLLGAYDNQLEVTVDAGTYTVGAYSGDTYQIGTTGTDVAAAGVISNHGCNLIFDTTGTIDFTVKGHWVLDGGRIYHGTESTPGTNSVTLTLSTNSNSTYYYGIELFYNSGIYIYSEEPTKGMYWEDGDGSTGDPLTGVPSDWSVGDRIVIGSGTAYADLEHKYIKTKPSSTTATLSDTDGGAESALSNTYDTTAYIMKTNRNFVIQSEDYTSYNAYIFYKYGPYGTTGDSRVLSKFVTTGVEYRRTYVQHNFNRPVYYSGCSTSFAYHAMFTVTGIGGVGLGEFYDHVWEQDINDTANNQGLNLGGTPGIIFNGGVLMNSNYIGMYLSSQAGGTFNDIIMRCMNSNSSAGAGILMGNTSANNINNLDYAGRKYAIMYWSGASASNKFIGGSFIGENQSISTNANVYVNDYYENVTVSSGIDGFEDTAGGTQLVIDTYNKQANNHQVITPNGTITTTGAGLADTTVKTSGNFSRKLEPTVAAGLTEVFRILSPVSGTASVFFSARRNSSFVGDVDFELWMAGATSAAYTYTWDSGDLPASDTWIPITLTATTTNTVPRYAEVRIVAKGTAGAVYFTDVYNGTTDDTGLRTYYEGRLGVLAPTIVDIPGIAEATRTAVWSDSTTYNAGEKGTVVQDASDNAELASIT